jgi:phage-related protein
MTYDVRPATLYINCHFPVKNHERPTFRPKTRLFCLVETTFERLEKSLREIDFNSSALPHDNFPMRSIIIYKHYFSDFYAGQTNEVKAKIDWTIRLIKELPRIPEQYFKHLEGTDGLYEIRVQQGNNIYRIFCFFDAGNLVVLGNAFQKKTQKTPANEINLALKIKKDYFDEKR